MLRLVRKQIYIESRQDSLLKEKSRLLSTRKLRSYGRLLTVKWPPFDSTSGT